MRNLFFILLIFFGNISILISQEAVVLSKINDRVNLGGNCSYLEDQDKVFTFSEITSPGFIPLFQDINKSQPGFGYSTSSYWFRCSVHNPLPEKIDFIIEIAYPLIDDIRFYNPISKFNTIESRMGDTYIFSQRPIQYRNFLFPLSLNSNQTNTYYFRILNKGPMVLPIHIWSYNELIHNISSENILIGIFLGIAIVMILYNAFLYSFFRELHYLYYVLFLFGLLILILTLTGVSFQYIWPNSIWWANYNFPIMIFFTSIWGILFTREILNTKQNAIIYDKVLYAAVYLNAFALAIPFLVDYVYSLRIALVIAVILLCIIYATVINAYLNQKSYSKYFLIAWTGFFIGIFIYQFYSLGWLPTYFISTWSIFIGSSFEIVLFALALAERINDIRKDKEEAQDEVIRMQKIAIENIKTNQKQQEQIVAINQELRIAKEIHESILPQTIPSPRGIKINVCYIPMAEIGGDLYEFFEDPKEDALGILIADVTGHGIPAAQVSSMVKAVFTFNQKFSNKPDRLLREMNTTLLSIQNNQMISAGYIYFDFKAKTATYANSGHPPLFLWRQKTKQMIKFNPEGKILGWMEDSSNRMETISYQKGDKFFLYTDGITNARRNINDIWGEDNFSRFIQDHIQLTPDDFVQELLQTLKNYSGSEDGFEDDITFIYIEV